MARIITQKLFSTHVLFVVILLYILVHATYGGPSFEKRVQLIEHLLSSNRSSKTIRPVKDGSHTINITMDMTLSNVIDMDEKYQILTSNVWLRQDEVRQILTVNMWLRQEWTNEMMIWDPDDWEGLTSLSLDASDVWIPDIVLYNNVFEEFDGRLDNMKTLVSVYHNGRTKWNAPFIFKTLCKIKVKNFPFDKQQCRLKFGSWRYSARQLNLWFAQETAKLDEKRIKNGEWNVDGVVVTRNALEYACCPGEIFPDITFVINIKRRSLFYMFNLIIPNFLIALLAFFSFYIPVECGERISFVMTVLLSMFVFLLLVAESIPPTSEAVPAIGVYFTSSIILVALALVATGLVLKINYTYLYVPGASFSPTLRYILFAKLGPVLGFKSGCSQVFDEDSTNITFLKRFMRRFDKTIPCKSSAKVVLQPNGGHQGKQLERSNPDIELTSQDNSSGTFIVDENAGQKDSFTQDIQMIANAVSSHEKDNVKSAECRLAAAIVDRFFMFLFVFVFIISTAIVLLIPYLSID